MKTTDEMMEEFSYLGARAQEIVVDNTNYIASLIDGDIRPVPAGKFPPKIEGAKETLSQDLYGTQHTRSTAIRCRRRSRIGWISS